ncbi:hypothetical protein V6N13_125422 [Hibiscus sabdariffa]|uniref:Uncharacterized protein n=1 Tax=Hibiscus sabdariffa TaxID=183260 RepID=A0ABR2U5L0_9ROSI
MNEGNPKLQTPKAFFNEAPWHSPRRLAQQLGKWRTRSWLEHDDELDGIDGDGYRPTVVENEARTEGRWNRPQNSLEYVEVKWACIKCA